MTLIDHAARLVFLHTPRTGGTAFYQAARHVLPHADILVANGAETHMDADQAATRWPEYQRVTITRSPYQILASCFTLHRHYATLDPIPPNLADGFDIIRLLARLPWPEYLTTVLANHYLCPPGGFSIRYAPPGVTVYHYDHDPYAKLARRLNVHLAMPRRNGFGPHPRYTPTMIDQVAHFCRADLRRFGYQPPTPK